MLRSTLLLLALVGCVQDDALQTSAPAGGVGDADVDWSGFSSGDPQVDGEPALASGVWAAFGATRIDDTCDLGSLGGDPLNAELTGLVLRPFAVAGGAQGFEFQVQGAGAVGPATCVLDGPAFDCEPQWLAGLAIGPEGAGWSVSIDFAGEVADARRVEGTAVLSLYSAGAAAGLDLTGTDDGPPICSQVVDIDLELLRGFDPDSVERPTVDRRPPPT